MAQGLLAKAFKGVAVKRLSAVEADINRSNQHEFNGSVALQRLMGGNDRRNIPTRFVWLGGESDSVTEHDFLSWYDARRRHPTRTEYRFYFPDTPVMDLAEEGDSAFFAVCPDDTMMVIITPAHSTIENQVAWLFGVQEQIEMQFSVIDVNDVLNDTSLEFAVRFILEELGIEPEEPESAKFDAILGPLGGKLPSTKEFSRLARSTLPEVHAVDDPDLALLLWMEREEQLFRRMERIIVEERLRNGFLDEDNDVDVNGFLSFSLSVQNRRKSRAGQALENHLEAIFVELEISFDRGAYTEQKRKPDFLFPSGTAYSDLSFDSGRLTMLGAKSTCKDRWRQVLSEAARINTKHLLTLEPGISVFQTEEMQDAKLQLVLPAPLHKTYTEEQQGWIMRLDQFIKLLEERASRS